MTDGGNDTDDWIFLLSLDEIRELSTTHTERIVTYKGEACWWWLRSPGGSAELAVGISETGGIHANGYEVNNLDGGIRPALWLKLD
jgi:hypothetical protein